MTASAETFWTSSLSFIILLTDAFGRARDFSADMVDFGFAKRVMKNAVVKKSMSTCSNELMIEGHAIK